MCVTIFHTTFYDQAAHRMLPMGVRSSGPPSIWPLGVQDSVGKITLRMASGSMSRSDVAIRVGATFHSALPDAES